MEDSNPPSPPLAPDRDQASHQQQQPNVPPSQEPFVAPSSPLQAQQQPEQQRTTTSRSRAGSINKPILHQPQPQPIRDAVDRAFGQSQPPNSLDPAFIAQVTEAVVKNLQSANLNQRTPAPVPAAQYPPPPSVHSVPQSPTSSTASLPPRHTPPSPQRGRGQTEYERRASASPISTFSNGQGTGGDTGAYSANVKANDRDGDTPKPVFGDTPVGARLNESIREEQDAKDLSRAEEGLASDAAASRRESRASVSSASGSAKSINSPNATASQDEVTTLERIWQPLFDNGAPTVRLSQFLRGIAIHIVEDFEPKGSLVITPAKMLRFFDQTRIDDEMYPWHLIFGGGMVSASISVMFRRLKCQHHLVQTQMHEAPNVPGLTPAGFETFLACLIQAHPDSEYERLSNAVKNMPISNADYRTERFPKELSRRLLPAQPNPIAEQCIIASMAHEANLLNLRNSTAMPPPPPSAPPQQQSAFPERERKPYSQSSFTAEANEDPADDYISPVALERERKPYSAKEGTGKIFGFENVRDEPLSSNYGRPNDPSNTRAPRPTTHDYNTSSSVPPDPRMAPPPRKHRSSVGPGMPPTGQVPGTGYPKGRRSPPPGGSYVRSDPVNVGDIPAAQYSSNLHGSRTQGQFDREPESSNYHAHRHHSNPGNSGFEEEFYQAPGRARPIPTRTNQGTPAAGTNFDSSYGSASTGSYPGPRVRNYDRRSMYGGPPNTNPNGGAGGTDGWGSYLNNSEGSGVYPSQQGYGNAGMQH